MPGCEEEERQESEYGDELWEWEGTLAGALKMHRGSNTYSRERSEERGCHEFLRVLFESWEN